MPPLSLTVDEARWLGDAVGEAIVEVTERVECKPPLRVFVTGTDTGVGKTRSACALLSLLADAGLKPAPFKPYESGCDSLDAPARRAARCGRRRGATIRSSRSARTASGAAGAGRGGARLRAAPSTSRRRCAAFRAFVGGRWWWRARAGSSCRIDARRDVIDLIGRSRLPVLLVARAGLGTLNHTALSLEALAARGIPVLAVLLSQCGARPRRPERPRQRPAHRQASPGEGVGARFLGGGRPPPSGRVREGAATPAGLTALVRAYGSQAAVHSTRTGSPACGRYRGAKRTRPRARSTE